MVLRDAAPVMALSFFGLVVSPHSACAATYANARFGYSITYPDDLLIPEREVDNSDGRAFHARHGAGTGCRFGARTEMLRRKGRRTIASLYQAGLWRGQGHYKVVKPRLVAFSCVTQAGQIIYQKILIDGDVLRSVRFDYPYSDRAVWDTVVKQELSSSLSAGSGAN